MELDLFVPLDLFIMEPPGTQWFWSGGRHFFLFRIHDHLARGAHSQKPLCGDVTIDNEKLGCAQRSLFHLEAAKTQSFGGEVEEARRFGGGGRHDMLPLTTIGTGQSFWTVSPACSVFLLWWLWSWDSDFSDCITVNSDFWGGPRPGGGVQY